MVSVLLVTLISTSVRQFQTILHVLVTDRSTDTIQKIIFSFLGQREKCFLLVDSSFFFFLAVFLPLQLLFYFLPKFPCLAL